MIPLRRLGQALTIVGAGLVVLTVGLGIASLATDIDGAIILDRAPSVVLTGVACFVLGVGLQEFG